MKEQGLENVRPEPVNGITNWVRGLFLQKLKSKDRNIFT